MKKKIVAAMAIMVSLAITIPAYAGSWVQDARGWWYQKDNGSYAHDCWRWIDRNNDGMAEEYFFNAEGYLLVNTTTPDGKRVDGNGARIDWEGKAVQKPVSGLVNAETTVTMKNGVPFYTEEVSTWDAAGQNTNGTATVETEDFTDEELANRIIELVNEEREKRGIAPLSVNDELMENAAVRAEETSEKFSHTRPDGTPYFTAITVSYERCSENIVGSASSRLEDAAQCAVSGWMQSPLHKANFLQSTWEETGVGVSRSLDGNGNPGYEVVQLFIKN